MKKEKTNLPNSGIRNRFQDLRTPRKFFWVGTAIISAILALSSWAVSSPVGSSPDDDYHNVSIWCGQGFRDGLCEEGDNGGAVVNETLRANYLCFSSRPENSGACEPSELYAETTRVNGGENPRVYYWVMSWFAGTEITPSVVSVRIANSVIIVLLFTLSMIYLPLHLRRIPLISAVVTSVPLGLFIIASTNPSSWGYSALLVLFPTMVGFLSTDQARVRVILGLLATVSLLMTAGSRPDSSLYAVIAVAIALFLILKKNQLRKSMITLGLLLAAAGIYLFASSGNTVAVLSGAPGGGLTFPSIRSTFFNFLRLPDLIVGVFGSWGLGWLDTPMPSIVWAITYGVFCGIVFASLSGFTIRQWAALAAVVSALIAIPMAALFASGLVVGQFVQPRYLMPLLGLVVGVALFRESRESGLVFSRGQLWSVALALVVANSVSLHTNLRRYLTGLDGNQINLNRDIEWWWASSPTDGSWFILSPNSLWVFGTVAFAFFLLAIWKLKSEIDLLGNSGQKHIADNGVSKSESITDSKTNRPDL